jgi:hypothetical protein
MHAPGESDESAIVSDQSALIEENEIGPVFVLKVGPARIISLETAPREF